MLRSRLEDGQHDIDIHAYVSKLALELISQAGFGTTFNSFENDDNKYAETLKQLA
jgi:hypothetical protein